MALNIIFMGTPSFAVPILKKLKESQHNIVAVYTQPPKKKIVAKKLISRQYIFILIKIK